MTILESITTITVSQARENGESNIGIPDRITTRLKLRNDPLHSINVCLTPRIQISHASRSELLTKPLCLKLDFRIMAAEPGYATGQKRVGNPLCNNVIMLIRVTP